MHWNIGRYAAIITYVIQSVLPQGHIQLTFSSNPVYSGEPLTLTFIYGPSYQLTQLTVDAFNGTLKKGYLFCKVAPANSTGVGVFYGKSLNGWPNILAGASRVSVTLTASTSLELDYNATAVVFDGSLPPVGSVLTSGPASLQIYVCPSPPTFQLSPVVLNESDSGVIICASSNGKPEANLLLSVSGSSGQTPATGSASNSVFVNLSSPLSKWHMATVTCRVTNHNCSNLNSTSDVRINYITNTGVPDVVYTNGHSVVLNVSAYISYYPSVVYRWMVPVGANVTGSLQLDSLTLREGQSGSFNCTVTNYITRASVEVVFTVSTAFRVNSGCQYCWIIAVVFGIAAVPVFAWITYCLIIRCKRKHSSQGPRNPDENPDSGNARLLIAAHGVDSMLNQRTLSTTTVVEYSDRSCSLNEILENVEALVPQSRNFKSVALLLHPARFGGTLSRVDEAVLNSSSIRGQNEEVCSFMASLVRKCFVESGDARLDILNFRFNAPERLRMDLTDLLGITTTVSRDMYGVRTPTRDNREHAFVAYDYFKCNHIEEVVYEQLR